MARGRVINRNAPHGETLRTKTRLCRLRVYSAAKVKSILDAGGGRNLPATIVGRKVEAIKFLRDLLRGGRVKSTVVNDKAFIDKGISETHLRLAMAELGVRHQFDAKDDCWYCFRGNGVPTPLERAISLLETATINGPVLATDAKLKAKDAGISENKLRQAARVLGLHKRHLLFGRSYWCKKGQTLPQGAKPGG